MGGCLRPHDSLWGGAHDARLTGDVVDEILGGKVDRADWSVAPDDPRTGARPRHKSSLPYRSFCSSCRTGRNARVRPVFFLRTPRAAPQAWRLAGTAILSTVRALSLRAATDRAELTELVVKFLRAFFCLKMAGWICAAWAVLGPWCEIYLALGLE